MGCGEVVTNKMAMMCMVLLVTNFVTAAKLAVFIMCILVTLGNVNLNRQFRIFWGLAMRATVEALLFACGLGVLPTKSITAALPFSIVAILERLSGWPALFREDQNTKDDTVAHTAKYTN